MTKEITSEILLVVANGVEPRPEGEPQWEIVGKHVEIVNSPAFYRPYKQDPYLYYNELQQLRIRDLLAEKGVVIYFDASRYNAARLMPDGTLEHIMRDCGDPLYTILAHHKSIDACAILAAHAVIEGKGDG